MAAVLGDVDDVARLLGANDVLVFTSVAEGEGMPGVLIEAGMAGLHHHHRRSRARPPWSITALPGLVVPVDDFDTLVCAARSLVVDAELHERLRRPRARCEAHFSLEASLAGSGELHRRDDGRAVRVLYLIDSLTAGGAERSLAHAGARTAG